MMKKGILSTVLATVSIPVVAQLCALCGGDGICDTCHGNGYLYMMAYGSSEMVQIACTEGCDNGRCPDCIPCEVCGGVGYLTMQAYGSDEMVKVACTNENCPVDSAPAPEPTQAPVRTDVLMLPSPTQFATHAMYPKDTSSSWKYSTQGQFDMDAYIRLLCDKYGLELYDTSVSGSCVFYDFYYTHPKTGEKKILCTYTFTSSSEVELTVIKPSAGGIALPEFEQEPASDSAAKATPRPTEKPRSANKFENAMEEYLKTH